MGQRDVSDTCQVELSGMFFVLFIKTEDLAGVNTLTYVLVLMSSCLAHYHNGGKWSSMLYHYLLKSEDLRENSQLELFIVPSSLHKNE